MWHCAKLGKQQLREMIHPPEQSESTSVIGIPLSSLPFYECGAILFSRLAYPGRPLAQADMLHDIGKGNAGFPSQIFPAKERSRSELRGHTREATYFLSDQVTQRKFVEKIRLREMSEWFSDGDDQMPGSNISSHWATSPEDRASVGRVSAELNALDERILNRTRRLALRLVRIMSINARRAAGTWR